MKNQRFQFLILTIIIFIVGFFLFGILGIIISLNNATTYVTDNPFYVGFFSLLGGYYFFSILSGLFFTVKWLSKKSFVIKILMTVVFVIPIYVVMAGVFYSIPYWIYNLIQYKRIADKAPTHV